MSAQTTYEFIASPNLSEFCDAVNDAAAAGGVLVSTCYDSGGWVVGIVRKDPVTTAAAPGDWVAVKCHGPGAEGRLVTHIGRLVSASPDFVVLDPGVVFFTRDIHLDLASSEETGFDESTARMIMDGSALIGRRQYFNPRVLARCGGFAKDVLDPLERQAHETAAAAAAALRRGSGS